MFRPLSSIAKICDQMRSQHVNWLLFQCISIRIHPMLLVDKIGNQRRRFLDSGSYASRCQKDVQDQWVQQHPTILVRDACHLVPQIIEDRFIVVLSDYMLGCQIARFLSFAISSPHMADLEDLCCRGIDGRLLWRCHGLDIDTLPL